MALKSAVWLNDEWNLINFIVLLVPCVAGPAELLMSFSEYENNGKPIDPENKKNRKDVNRIDPNSKGNNGNTETREKNHSRWKILGETWISRVSIVINTSNQTWVSRVWLVVLILKYYFKIFDSNSFEFHKSTFAQSKHGFGYIALIVSYNISFFKF